MTRTGVGSRLRPQKPGSSGCAVSRMLYPQGRPWAWPDRGPRRPCGYKVGERSRDRHGLCFKRRLNSWARGVTWGTGSTAATGPKRRLGPSPSGARTERSTTPRLGTSRRRSPRRWDRHPGRRLGTAIPLRPPAERVSSPPAKTQPTARGAVPFVVNPTNSSVGTARPRLSDDIRVRRITQRLRVPMPTTHEIRGGIRRINT